MKTILNRSMWSRTRRQVLSPAAHKAAPKAPAARFVAEPLEDRRLMSTVALFDNGTYVDTANTPGAESESDNLQAVLAGQSHTVKLFTGTSGLSFRKAAAGAELIMIPEIEIDSLSGAMSSSDKAALAAYVNRGGGLIMFGDFSDFGLGLLNSTFGFSLSSAGTLGSSSLHSGNAAGTAFSSGPGSLPGNNATNFINTSSLPSGGKAIYTNGSAASVALIGYGEGSIAYVGYDFFDAQPAGTQDGGWRSLLNKAVTEVKLPDQDSNDEIGEAASLAINSTASNKVDYVGDIDFYKFTGTAGKQVTISMTKDGSSLDAFLRVFDADGNQLAFNDDAGAGTNDSKILFTPSSSGTYYVGCSAFGNQTYDPITGLNKNKDTGTTGNFKLLISGASANTDNDDQVSEAKSVGLGSTTNASISTAGLSGGQPAGQDVDMYKFTVSAGQKIQFDVDRRNGSSLDSYLRVFSYNSGTNTATELKNNDNAAAPGESLGKESYIEYTFASAGTYYAGVSGFANKTYGPVTGTSDVSGSTGDYAFTLKLVGAPAGDPDDQLSEAKSVGSTSTNTGQSISPGSDVDMYKFTVSAGQKIQFDIDRPSGTLNSRLRLFTSGGTQLATNDNAAAPGESANSMDAYLQFTFSAAGTYYIGVSNSGNTGYNPSTGLGDGSGSSTGAYTLILKTV